MSWDVFLFNSTEKIDSIEELNEEALIPTKFSLELEKYFTEIKINENHRRVSGQDFTLEFFADDEPGNTVMINLYGENGIYELIKLAKQLNWQIFDTGLGEMINLEDPASNGYQNFQNYLDLVINSKK